MSANEVRQTELTHDAVGEEQLSSLVRAIVNGIHHCLSRMKRVSRGQQS